MRIKKFIGSIVYRHDNIIYFIITLVPHIKYLNEPDLEFSCQCGGKSVIFKKDDWGLHMFCCRCFTSWIKPAYGLSYRRKDFRSNCKRA